MLRRQSLQFREPPGAVPESDFQLISAPDAPRPEAPMDLHLD